VIKPQGSKRKQLADIAYALPPWAVLDIIKDDHGPCQPEDGPPVSVNG